MLIEDINESMCIIRNIDIDTFNSISPKLCVKVQGAEFTPKYKIGLWDGMKRFYRLNGTDFMFPKGLVEYVIKKLKTENIQYSYNPIQYSMTIPSFEEFCEFVDTLNLPFKPYDYQLTSAYEGIRDKRRTSVISTGGGKSLVIYMVIRWMMQNEYKSVLIVPTIMLTTQMYEDFKSYGMEDIESVHLIGGDNKVKHFDKPVTISTWQSLIRSSELFEGVHCMMIDECLSENTTISIKGGTKKIKDIIKGELVLTKNETTHDFEYKPVIKVHKNLMISNSEKMYRVTTKSGKTIEMTGNHKVLTEHGWKETKLLSTGDKIANI